MIELFDKRHLDLKMYVFKSEKIAIVLILAEIKNKYCVLIHESICIINYVKFFLFSLHILLLSTNKYMLYSYFSFAYYFKILL